MTHALFVHDVAARERPHLLRVAYRMLGSRGEAEDVVQEALARLPAQDTVASPRAFLTTVVTRLCLDELKSARRRRETYDGPWLPEPWLDTPSPEDVESQRSEASLALLLVLEQLTPKERVVFVLRELCDCDFAEIALSLGSSEQACRKILSRARAKLAEQRPLEEVPRATEAQLCVRFFAALALGDLPAVVAMLAPDVEFVSDHGGKAKAVRNLLRGADVVSRFFAGLMRKHVQYEHAGLRLSPQLVHSNGRVALTVMRPDGSCELLVAFDVVAGADGPRIARALSYRNPDKLTRIHA